MGISWTSTVEWFRRTTLYFKKGPIMSTRGCHVEKALVHHTDRGVQYASVEYRKRLGERDVVCSMSRKGDYWDSAAAKSFFSTLKVWRSAQRGRRLHRLLQHAASPLGSR